MSDEDVQDRLNELEEDIESLEARVNRMGESYVGVDKLREKVDALESLVSSEL